MTDMTSTRPPSAFGNFLRSVGVHFSIVLAAVLFVASIALLYYRSLNLVEPSSIVDVRGDASLDGATVQIRGPGLNAPLKTVFDKQHGYSSRFFLDGGSYILSVVRGDKTLYKQHFFLADRTHATLPIDPAPATQP